MKYWTWRLFDAIKPRLDWPLFALLLIILVAGCGVLYSAAGERTDILVRQIVRIAAGGGALWIGSRMSPSTLRLIAVPAYLVTLALLLAVLHVGEGAGADRWLDLGVVRFQPSEMAKLSLPLMLAAMLHGASLPIDWRRLLAALVIIAVPAVLVLGQPDLGTAILISASGAALLFFAGLSWRLIVTGIVAGLAALPVLWTNMHEYQRNRVLVLLDPEADPLGQGWNIIQSKIAIGSGGVYGKGWQAGSQAHLDFLPEQSTDFILAVLSEEFGLVGVLLLLLAYLLIVWRCFWLAQQANSTFSTLLSSALAVTFACYVLVNAGMVSGLLPIVGVPLPLISYGGTSIVTLLGSFGLIMGLTQRRR